MTWCNITTQVTVISLCIYIEWNTTQKIKCPVNSIKRSNKTTKTLYKYCTIHNNCEISTNRLLISPYTTNKYILLLKIGWKTLHYTYNTDISLYIITAIWDLKKKTFVQLCITARKLYNTHCIHIWGIFWNNVTMVTYTPAQLKHLHQFKGSIPINTSCPTRQHS